MAFSGDVQHDVGVVECFSGERPRPEGNLYAV